MNGKAAKNDEIEVSSDQLKAELIEIKERLGALETIASISNKTVVEAFVKEHLTTAKGKLGSSAQGRDFVATTGLGMIFCL
jgi:hypothetical protein